MDTAGPEHELAAALLPAFRKDFAEREPSALQLAELFLDAVDRALPLTDHRPAEPALAELELLATAADVFAWDGAPGWDELLLRGLLPRPRLPAGSSVLDGIGAHEGREAQRGELKRRARAEARRLLELARKAHQGPGALVQAHSALLRLLGHAVAAPLLFLPEDLQAGALPPAGGKVLAQELDERDAVGSEISADEWLARLLADNPAAAAEPAFRTFFAGLSQTLRTARALRDLERRARSGALAAEPEALIGALGGWQPVRWQALRHGAPTAWLAALCPAGPLEEPPLDRLARECALAFDLAGRLWSARGLSLTGFTTLASLFVARATSVVALWQELAGA